MVKPSQKTVPAPYFNHLSAEDLSFACSIDFADEAEHLADCSGVAHSLT